LADATMTHAFLLPELGNFNSRVNELRLFALFAVFAQFAPRQTLFVLLQTRLTRCLLENTQLRSFDAASTQFCIDLTCNLDARRNFDASGVNTPLDSKSANPHSQR